MMTVAWVAFGIWAIGLFAFALWYWVCRIQPVRRETQEIYTRIRHKLDNPPWKSTP